MNLILERSIINEPIIPTSAAVIIVAIFVIIMLAIPSDAEDLGHGIESNRPAYRICLAICAIMIYGAVVHHKETVYNDVTLSKIDSKIKVNNDKVIIDPISDSYKYKLADVNNDAASKNQQIFKFEQDDFYNKNYLIDSNGYKHELSEEDANYLKSKQSKGE